MVVANLSGGRDSTAMVVKCLEMGETIDYIIFCDTGYEFPQMYEYIDKLDNYIEKQFNKKITRLDSRDKIMYWAFEKPFERGEHIGRLRGLPKVIGKEYCTRETKVRPTARFILDRSRNKFRNTALIGYTFNEVEKGRTSTLDYAMCRYPLHELKWNEAEVTEFLKSRGIMNPLYNHFGRTGCFLCPKQNKKAFYSLWKYYPQQWEFMKQLEVKAKELNCVNQTFRINQSLLDLEKEFKSTDSDSLFETEFDYQETCFCRT